MVSWSDLPLVAIFENGHISADEVYFYQFNSTVLILEKIEGKGKWIFFKLQTPLSFVANTNPIVYVVKSLQQNQFHKLKVSQALSLLEFYKKGLRISALCQEYISRGKLVLALPRSATRKEEKEEREQSREKFPLTRKSNLQLLSLQR